MQELISNIFPADNKGYNPIIADDIIAEPYAVGQAICG